VPRIPGRRRARQYFVVRMARLDEHLEAARRVGDIPPKSSGYTTNRGTYVQPYVATNPNSTQRDNYSATGNVNPYTGVVGPRNRRY
jgi:hypothetical protein